MIAERRAQSTVARRAASALPAWVLAAALAGVWLVVQPPVGDLAAQEYRAGLGLVLWDNGWYGGHHMPAYSVLFPPPASLLGAPVVGALAAVASAAVFERLVRGLPGARAGALWFAAGSATTLLTGRLTFALGAALGLAAALAITRRRTALACLAAALSGLASPVAAAFVALGAAAWWLDRRGWAPVALAATAVVPAGALAVAFPEGGSFPFVASSFWPALVLVVVLATVFPRVPRVVRLGTVLYALAIAASFVLDTAMGGNVVRLGALLAGPLAACLLWRSRPVTLAVLALPLVYWQWAAPIDNVVRAAGDPSVHASYYDGLVRFLSKRPGGPARVEIPFTESHGEARWVAPRLALARGWERQVDIDRNGLFYDDRPLTAGRYRRWLDDDAVRYVALSDARPDYSARAEARLVRSGPAYLREVWRDAHWRVYAVAGARGLARGPARVTRLGPEEIALQARAPGVVDLRVRYTPYWRITRGRGCVGPGPGGWTRLTAAGAGALVVAGDFAVGRIRARSPRCSG